MIIFRTDTWDWDITDKGLTFNEVSNHFTDEQRKSFTFPSTVEVNEDLAEKFGLVTINGVVKYPQRIYGFLQKDHNFFDAYIQINTVVGTKVSFTIFYGSETLKVFDKKLKQLPFAVTQVGAGSDLPTFAQTQLEQSWPDVTHQFVKVFRDDLGNSANYEYFENFLNNYVYDDEEETWSFPVNTNEDVEGVSTAINRNVMVPFPYLIEVLRVIFKSEGKIIRGDFVDDTFNHKILMVPQNFMEQFAASTFENYSFSTYTSQTLIDNQVHNVYTKSHTPASTGSYSIKIRVNFTDAMAQYFHLTVKQGTTTFYEAQSTNTFVNIDETVEINITSGAVFDDIIVQLTLKQQTTSIAAYNQFTYEYKEGALNVFPEVYTIADYMPDMLVRDFINKIRTWFNLKFDYTDNAVYINYLENHLRDIIFKDKSHLEMVYPSRTMNTNNLFKLTYPNGEQVFVNSDGQTYDETNYSEDETVTIDMEVLPLGVRYNYGSLTAYYPEEETDLMFVLFDGTTNGDNVAVDHVDERKLSLQHVYNNQWRTWLNFRANSETYKDSFNMHFTETLSMEEGVFKYNKNHIIKSINKKRLHTEYYKVDVESETF